MKKMAAYLSLVLVLLIFPSPELMARSNKPQKAPKIETPSAGGGGNSQFPHDVLIPLNCRDDVGYRDCYRSQTRYCPQEMESQKEACYSNAVTQCTRAYCNPEKK